MPAQEKTLPRSRNQKLISIVTPAYNEEENLNDLYKAVFAALDGHDFAIELLICENGSSDKSLEILRDLSAKDSRVQYVSLSRNFGSQGGLVAGLEHCRGDIIVTMDADLQHPPNFIPHMLEAWEQGFDIVNTRRENAAHAGVLRLFANNLYFWTMTKITDIPMQARQSDFRLFDRKALDALLEMPERSKFLRGLSHWIGFRQTSLGFEVQERHAGVTKFKLLDLIKFAIEGATSFSVLPLHIFAILGLLVSCGSLLYGVTILVSSLFGQPMPSGFASLAIGTFFLGGIQLIGIGILGEYIGKIFGEVRGRPTYIIREISKDVGSNHNDDR